MNGILYLCHLLCVSVFVALLNIQSVQCLEPDVDTDFDPGRFATSCHTQYNAEPDSTMTATATVSAQSPPWFNIECRVTFARSSNSSVSASSSIVCETGNSIKVFVGPDSAPPVVHCTSSDEMSVSFQFMESAGSPFYEDNLVHYEYDSKYANSSILETRAREHAHAITLKPVGRISTKYEISGPFRTWFPKSRRRRAAEYNNKTGRSWLNSISILVLYSEGRARARPEDVKIYSPVSLSNLESGGEGEPTPTFTASTDDVVIPCFNGLDEEPLMYEIQTMKANANDSRTCTSSLLDSPTAVYVPTYGIYLTLEELESVDFSRDGEGSSSSAVFMCCPSTWTPKPGESDSSCSFPVPGSGCQKFRVVPPQDLEVEPAMPLTGDPIRFFGPEDELVTVKVSCSAWKPVKLRGTKTKSEAKRHSHFSLWPSHAHAYSSFPVELELNEGDKYKVEQSSVKGKTRHSVSFYDFLWPDSKLDIECVQIAGNGQTETVLYTWNFTTHDVEIPQSPFSHSQHLLNFGLKLTPNSTASQTFLCSSGAYNNTRLRAVRCENEQQCNLLKWCFKSDDPKCGDVVTEGVQCLDNGNAANAKVKVKTKSCTKLEMPGPGALFQCTAGPGPEPGSYEYVQQRWLGLRGTKSYKFEEIYKQGAYQKREMIYAVIDGPTDANGTYYAGVKYNVTCVMHPFFVSRKARFWFQVEDEQIDTSEAEARGDADAFAIDRTNIVPSWALTESVQLKLPSSSVISVRCSARRLGEGNTWISGSTGRLRVRALNSMKLVSTNTGWPSLSWVFSLMM